MYYFLTLFLITLVTACASKEEKQKKVILIAVENLSFNDFSCSSLMDEELVGFNELCQESIFYTHAYTPSPYAPTVIASLFTGLYPNQHNLTAPNQYLNEFYSTINEKIVKKGYRTSLFSSGGSLFKYTGLDQGIETFDDVVGSNQLFNSSDKVLTKFKIWYQQNRKSDFLSVLYFSDPFYPFVKSIDNDGFARFSSRSNQIKNISESIFNLKKLLKDKNQWDTSTIIFIGLNGVSSKASELKLTNLYSENVHVPVLIKPKRKKRDLGQSWKIDKNISLVDIGHYLEDIFGVQQIENLSSRINLSQSLEQVEANWDSDRAIFTSISWLNKGHLAKIISFRIQNILYLFKDKKVRQYNSLIDNAENIELAVDKDSNNFKNLNILKARFKVSLSQYLNSKNLKTKKLSEFVKAFWVKTQEINFWPMKYIYQEAHGNHLLKQHFEYWALLNNKVNLLNKKMFNNINSDYLLLNKQDLKLSKGDSCLSYFMLKMSLLYQTYCKDNLSNYIWKHFYGSDKNKNYKLRIRRLLKAKYFKNKLKIQNIAKGYIFYGVDYLKLDIHWSFKLFYMKKYKKIIGNDNLIIYSL